jgi:hypothetical protein
MKSKKFILNQIKEIVDAKGKDGDAFVATLGEKTVYELLVVKKDVADEEDLPDVHPHHWFKKDMRDYYNRHDDAAPVGEQQ